MRNWRYTGSQILAIMKQHEKVVPVPELCREYGMSSAQFYKWRALSTTGENWSTEDAAFFLGKFYSVDNNVKFGGMSPSIMKRLKELEDENKRLKKMYTECKYPINNTVRTQSIYAAFRYSNGVTPEAS